MKKVMIITATLALISLSLQAGSVEMKTSGPSGQGNLIWWAPSTGVTNLTMTTTGLRHVTIDPTYSIIFGDITFNNATIRTNVTVGGTLDVTGKTTLSSELQVDGSVVDINFTHLADVLTIDQTNATGTASTPLCKITDARTGSYANENTEASLVINASGTYGLYIQAGTADIQAINAAGAAALNGGATVNGTLTMNGAVNVLTNKVTMDASGNLIAAGAISGATVSGGINATNLTGNVLAARITNALGTSGGSIGGNIPAAAITNAVVDGSVPLPSANITGNIAQARITNALIDAIGPDQMADADHGDVSWASGVATVDNVAAANITGNIAQGRISNALETAGALIGGNIPVASLTNGAGSIGPNIGGNIPQAALTNAMPTMPELAINNGTSLTGVTALAMNATGLTGDIASDRMTNALPNIAALAVNNGTSLTGVTALAMSAAGLTAGTTASAIDGQSITNLTGANIAPAGKTVTNTWLSGEGWAITNVQIFMHGRLTSWTTNGGQI